MEQWQREQAGADSDTVWTAMHAATANAIARTIIPVMQKEHFTELHRQLHDREEDRREEAAEDEHYAQRRRAESFARTEAAKAGRAGRRRCRPGSQRQRTRRRGPRRPGVAKQRMRRRLTQKDEQDGQEVRTDRRRRDEGQAGRSARLWSTKSDGNEQRAANAFTD